MRRQANSHCGNLASMASCLLQHGRGLLFASGKNQSPGLWLVHDSQPRTVPQSSCRSLYRTGSGQWEVSGNVCRFLGMPLRGVGALALPLASHGPLLWSEG